MVLKVVFKYAFFLVVYVDVCVGRVTRSLTDARVKDGGICYVGKDLLPTAPFCAGGKYSCVVDHVSKRLNTSYVAALRGHCNSTYLHGSYCAYQSVPFRVGTSGITSQSTCVSCTCKLHTEILRQNKAQCDCDPLPPCFQSYDGKAVGRSCPPPETTCIVKKIGVRRAANGLPIDEGSCHFPGYTQKPLCVAAGKGWGPKFYASGVKGVPLPGNRCVSCQCLQGAFKNCKPKKGCTKP